LVTPATNQATKPRVWTVFLAYVTAFGAISSLGGVVLIGFVIVQLIRANELSAEPDSKAIEKLVEAAATEPWFVLASAAISAAVLGGIALVAAKLGPTAVHERLRLGRARVGARGPAVAVLTAVAALAAGSAVMSSMQLVLGRRSDVLASFERAARSSGSTLVLTVALLAVTTPIAEELFFRGYAQTRLVARFGRRSGILLATALFALFHLDPMQGTGAFAIGAVLAWTTERTGSIRAALVAHAVNNGLFVAGTHAAPMPTTWVASAGFGLATVVALFGIARLTRPPRAAPAG
jgi:membrane protease YdiL (CAAX protease family)